MAESSRPRVYIFGWPSRVGGADTKLAHLLRLLHKDCLITVCPNDECRLSERDWCKALDRLGIRTTMLNRLPRDLDGIALSLCNDHFFTKRIAHQAKERGLRVVWSSEMMWHHAGELEAVREGLIDHVLYVSEFQKAALARGYGAVPGTISGNYIDPDGFPFAERRHSTFTIGRLSRPAPEKYPEDFPVFYECIGLPDVRFRVMAWSDELARKYRWHDFDARWELLGPGYESTLDFLHSLDLFVYPLGHGFRESWGRSTVEAMLTGAVPLVPRGHQFEDLMVGGESGFICGDIAEWQEYALRLRMDFSLRQKIARQAREHAVTQLCNAEEHRRVWLEMFVAVEQGRSR